MSVVIILSHNLKNANVLDANQKLCSELAVDAVTNSFTSTSSAAGPLACYVGQ